MFHFSFYLTLALATVCLGVAELFFLPWIFEFIVVVWGFYFLAWKLEGRWHLTEQAANSVGLVIAFGMIGWMVFQVPKTEEDLLAGGVPWPAGMLPSMGPLLMILAGAKLFRPKTNVDFWGYQVLGLMMVTLASVLAAEVHHALWVLLYFVSLNWCLILYYQRPREHGSAPLFAKRNGDARMPRRGLISAVGWSVLAFGLGIGIFLAAPRGAGSQWVPHKLMISGLTSFSSGLDTEMDQNATGKLELSEEIAFEIACKDAKGQLSEIPENLYWRGEVHEFYQKGKWLSASHSTESWPELEPAQLAMEPLHNREPVSIPDIDAPHPDEPPANMAANHLYFIFRLRPGVGGSVLLAQPPSRDLGLGLHAYRGSRAAKSAILAHFAGGDSLVSMTPHRRGSLTYGQVWDPFADRHLLPATPVHSVYRDHFLLQPPPEALVPWTREFLLASDGLADAERVFEGERVAPKFRAAVAKTLTRRLADSNEYLYSLNLRRSDRDLDPTVDFLLNIKQGHCERYASGLALMLRSLGIPCRIVHGYRGLDKGDETHFVRMKHAHAWVEALIPNPTGPGERWLQLDPTPSLEAPLDHWQQLEQWAREAYTLARQTFRNFVMDYGADDQAGLFSRILDDVLAWFQSGSLVPWLMGGAAMLFAGWRWRKGRGRRVGRNEAIGAASRLPWVRDHLRAIQARFGATHRPNQTMLEFLGDLPRSTPVNAAEAAALTLFGSRFNEVCYGRRRLTRAMESELAATLAAWTS